MLKISITGDLMCLMEQNQAILSDTSPSVSYDEIFQYVKPLFKESDYVIGNLETPVSNSCLSDDSICFNTPPEFLAALKRCGFDFLSTANNHCLDRGVQGIEDTLLNLNRIGIAHSGTYLTENASNQIFIENLKGINVAIVCGTFGTNSEYNHNVLPEGEQWRIDLLKRQNKPARSRFDPSGGSARKMISDNVSSAAISNKANQPYLEKFLSKVRQGGQMADIVIVLPHVGGQYNPYPARYTRHVVERIAECRPSLIACSHPHVPLHCQAVNNVFTAYSLGNFTFTPDTGYFLVNTLAEYGLILHSYWNLDTVTPPKITFSIVKNVVGEDRISRTMPVSLLMNKLKSTLERERLEVEVSAVANRVAARIVDNPFTEEIPLT